jgi:two-component system nitrogen regulation response regulator NtrX
LLLGSDQSSEQKVGLLEQASSGTLYIDDIGELDHVAQTALYGALTSPVTYRMGSERAINVDVRVIVATRFNLEEEVQAGHFREDLFYCLNAYPLHVAPLREHSEDVSELVQYYVNLFADQGGLPYRNFTVAAQNALRNYHWPGNVLELEYFVRRILTQGAEPTIERDEVEAMLDEAANKAIGFQTGPVPEFELPLRQAREHFEIAYLSYHLNQAGGSVGKVAKVVGMERTHLYRKLRTLGIDAKDYPKNVKQ